MDAVDILTAQALAVGVAFLLFAFVSWLYDAIKICREERVLRDEGRWW